MQLVPQSPQQPHHSPLALWHLLSLDAPTVATLWTLFVAHCASITLPWPEPSAMFVAVWMIYAADRLLDARQLDARPPNASQLDTPDLEARHRFHHRYRSQFLAVITLCAFALVYLLHCIDARALHLYVLLATLLAVWMLLIHARPLPNGTTRRLPKELAVGIFFPAAIFIPTIARAPWLRPTLLPAAILFACVCTLNCLYLYAWEHPAPRLHTGISDERSRLVRVQAQQAHWTTRWATQHLTHLAALTITLATLTAALCFTQHTLPFGTTTSLSALACALSATALLLLNHLRDRLSAIHLRASADLVLLTPLLFLPFLHLFAK